MGVGGQEEIHTENKVVLYLKPIGAPVTGPSDILFFSYVCAHFSARKFTGRGSEGVNLRHAFMVIMYLVVCQFCLCFSWKEESAAEVIGIFKCLILMAWLPDVIAVALVGYSDDSFFVFSHRGYLHLLCSFLFILAMGRESKMSFPVLS